MAVSTEHRGSTYGQVSAAGIVGLLIAGVVLLGSIVGDAFLAVYVASGSSDFPPRFAGWQVDAVEAADAAALLSLSIASAFAFRRQWRPTPVSSRRLAILLAVVPGLAIGGCLSVGGKAASTWAGNHTAEAAEARAWQAAYRISPPPMPVLGPPAAPVLTAKMLTPRDLGVGWYQGTQPAAEGVTVTSEERSQGQISKARTTLSQQHWAGTAWALDRTEIERITQFDTPAHAAAYLATWRQQNAGSTLTTSTSGEVSVAIAKTKIGDLTAFIVADDVINLNVSNTPTSQPETSPRSSRRPSQQCVPSDLGTVRCTVRTRLSRCHAAMTRDESNPFTRRYEHLVRGCRGRERGWLPAYGRPRQPRRCPAALRSGAARPRRDR